MKKSKKIALLVGALLLAAGLAVSLIALAMIGFDFGRLSTEQYEEKTFSFAGPVSALEIHGASHDVRILPWEEDGVRVVCYESERVSYEVKTEADTLSVSAVSSGSARWFGIFMGKEPVTTVYLPAAEYESLTLRNGSGDVRVEDGLVFGRASVEALSGDIAFFADVTGNLAARCKSGNLFLADLAAGACELESTSGDLTLKDVACGPLSVQTLSGDLNIIRLKGEDVTLRTTSGDLELDGAECASLAAISNSGELDFHGLSAEGDVTLESSSGDVELEKSFAGAFSIATSSGSVHFERSDADSLSVTTSSGDVRGSLLSAKFFSVRSSSGSIRIPESDREGGICEIRTSSGDIKIEIIP